MTPAACNAKRLAPVPAKIATGCGIASHTCTVLLLPGCVYLEPRLQRSIHGWPVWRRQQASGLVQLPPQLLVVSLQLCQSLRRLAARTAKGSFTLLLVRKTCRLQWHALGVTTDKSCCAL